MKEKKINNNLLPSCGILATEESVEMKHSRLRLMTFTKKYRMGHDFSKLTDHSRGESAQCRTSQANEQSIHDVLR